MNAWECIVTLGFALVCGGMVYSVVTASEAMRSLSADVKRFVDAADRNEREARGE